MKIILLTGLTSCFCLSSLAMVLQGDIFSTSSNEASAYVPNEQTSAKAQNKFFGLSYAEANASTINSQTTTSENNSINSTVKTTNKAISRKQLIKSIKSAKKSKSITGFGGKKFNKKSKVGKKLIKMLKKTRKGGKTCAFLMVDIKTGIGLSAQANKKIYGASTVKAPYAAAICKYKSSKINSSAKSHIKGAISWSDNEDYRTLRSKYGTSPINKFKKYCGANEMITYTTWATYSPKTLAKLWAGQYWYLFKDTNKHSKWLRKYYKSGKNSFIKKSLNSKKNYTTYTKAGWCTISGKGYIYNDAGIIKANGRKYLLVIMSEHNCSSSLLRKLVKTIDKYHTYIVKNEQ